MKSRKGFIIGGIGAILLGFAGGYLFNGVGIVGALGIIFLIYSIRIEIE